MFKHLVLQKPLAFIDLETTGIDPQVARIVEISVLIVDPDTRRLHRTYRINPGVPIPPEATAVHGITDADVAQEPRFAQVAADLCAMLDSCDLCGFDLKRFDLRVLHHEFDRAGRPLTLSGRVVIDAMEIFHARERRDLSAAVRFYCGRDHERAHAAAADVTATADVLDAMLARYADLPRTPAGLEQHLKDPKAVDSAGHFIRVEGEVRFAFGKCRGQSLDAVAKIKPDYLHWMLTKDFPDDAKELVRQALHPSTTVRDR
jgi:DNA polymerase-3 subunit epsilon